MTSHPRAPRLTVKVTDEMIEDAIPRSSGHCVFAEAVKAAYPAARFVAVDLQTVRFSDPSKGLRFTYLTPRPWQLSLIQFDQGIKPLPFSIQLRNGQVTAAGRRAPARDTQAKPKSAKRQAQAKRARQKKDALRKATLVDRESTGQVPDKVGGQPPPTAPGRRRAFGLRSLEM